MRRKLLVAGVTLAFAALVAPGIVADLLTAMQRSRQTRTMAGIATVATAWEARATDTDSYDVGTGRIITTAALAAALEPAYVKQLPRTDDWGADFELTAGDYDDAGRAQTYVIRSFASDGRADRDPSLPRGATTDFTDDIVHSNGAFIQFPEGAG